MWVSFWLNINRQRGSLIDRYILASGDARYWMDKTMNGPSVLHEPAAQKNLAVTGRF